MRNTGIDAVAILPPRPLMWTGRSEGRRASSRPISWDFNLLETGQGAGDRSRFSITSARTRFTAAWAGRLLHGGNAVSAEQSYSASKASSDHLIRAYNVTYGLPITLFQLLQQLRTLSVSREAHPPDRHHTLEGKTLPVYGVGKNVRDWLYVRDHCEATGRS